MTQEDGAADRAARYARVWRRRWLLIAAMTASIAGLLLAVRIDGQAWSWPLFAWGIAIGVLPLVVVLAGARIVSRTRTLSADARLWRRRRMTITAISACGSGLICGIGAGGFDAAWIDVVATVWVLIVYATGALIAVRMRRRRVTRA